MICFDPNLSKSLKVKFKFKYVSFVNAFNPLVII